MYHRLVALAGFVALCILTALGLLIPESPSLAAQTSLIQKGGVIAGSGLAAQQFPERPFLPFVAENAHPSLEGTPTPTLISTPIPLDAGQSSSLWATNVRHFDTGGQLTIMGDVENSGAQAVTSPEVCVTLYDGNGRVINAARATLDVVLRPEEYTL